MAHPILSYDALAAASSPQIYEATEWKNLLHYQGNASVINHDSDFFLAPEGSRDPKAEYLATLKAMSDPNIELGNRHAVCRYPARLDYIVKALRLNRADFPTPQCSDYKEYQAKVPIDTVSVVFAAENNLSPSSMMGHSFLKLSGTNESGQHEHAFSYFAALDLSEGLKFYWDIITTGLDGAYVLSPYREKSAEYLYKESRSLWEFDIKLSAAEIENLKKHLWELKGSNIRYSLISHNCNTAVISILKTANPKFDTQSIKPFVTPVEYVEELYAKDDIAKISIEPTDYTREKINRYGAKNILTTDKSSRLELSQHLEDNYSLLRLSPVYQDNHDVNTAYFDYMESKIGEVTFGYSEQENHAFIQSLDILKMSSILDYPIAQDYSKHFKLSLENDLGQTTTDLKPTVEFGLGYGAYGRDIAVYALPKVGFRYHDTGNLYLAPEIGAIAQINDTIKVMTSYEYFLNSRYNNRGYNGKFEAFTGYKLSTDVDVYATYARYTDAAQQEDFSLGIAYKF